ncbi:MAG: 3-deoxy-7-phosphoheptulonate synthase class II [Myxococcota bacterium]|nr:3-deoxy-7-phosphoheptulonate synthase class II [Myxococcota bacterium]
MSQWEPKSWRSRVAAQQPDYPDRAALDQVLGRLHHYPPLVSVGECQRLRQQLAEAAAGQRFLLQGGDCAERFVDLTGRGVVNKLKILLQMSLVLSYGARKPIIRVGRMAGQYAKPRSSGTEVVGGVELPTFRGDNVNDLAADPRLRTPDPARLERGYFSSAATLNFVRALLKGGFANLREPEHWQLDFIPASGIHAGYREIADRIRDAIDYLESLGSAGEGVHEVDFFTSHEALLLPYEEALTRQRQGDRGFHNLGAHFLWLGERTRQLDGAHVEYFRGIQNPIGVKLGPGVSPEELLRLIDLLDPDALPGRLTLITRFGKEKISRVLPPLVRAVKEAGRQVLWSCDPMHGNSHTTADGLKTRAFDDIGSELKTAFEIHHAEGSVLGGVHFELTGENVTECVGGVEALVAADLRRAYESGCDPRLNYAQSMEMAFLIGALLRQYPSGKDR